MKILKSIIFYIYYVVRNVNRSNIVGERTENVFCGSTIIFGGQIALIGIVHQNVTVLINIALATAYLAYISRIQIFVGKTRRLCVVTFIVLVIFVISAAVLIAAATIGMLLLIIRKI